MLKCETYSVVKLWPSIMQRIEYMPLKNITLFVIIFPYETIHQGYKE
jgi:hypothetical protein